jgi:3',5'-cyclic AMP phosphodiesterase CpdA
VEAGAARSEQAALATAAQPGERLRFVVYGDNRTDGDAHRRVVEAIEAEGPDFLVNTGDLVDASNAGEWQSFFDIEYSLLLHTPFYPALGNHEADSGGGGRFAQLFPVGEKQRFGGRAYGADFGDVHLAVIDSNGDLGSQATWLDNDLAAARARNLKHLYVVMHHGPFSGGRMLLHGSNDEAREHIVPVARKYGVEALFGGHDHFYERGDSNGLAYFVSGGGGAPLHPAGSIAETKYAWSTHHYIVIDVFGTSAHATAKTVDGVAFDQIDLAK